MKFNALGGPAVLSFLARGVLVIAVKDNHTTMEVDPAALSSMFVCMYVCINACI